MTYRGTCLALLLLIFIEIFLTSIRPTWVDGGDIAHYILVGIHVLVVLLEGIMVFVLFSSTIWFAAGLLGQLFFAITPTLPCWVLRFVICWLPWVYKRFVENGEATPWSYSAYVFLVILDVLSCLALCISLCYTMCAMSDKRMYVPYHLDVGQNERESATAMNATGFTGIDRAHDDSAETNGEGNTFVGMPSNGGYYNNNNRVGLDMLEMTAVGGGNAAMVDNFSMAVRGGGGAYNNNNGNNNNNGRFTLQSTAGMSALNTNSDSDALGATRGPATRNTSLMGGTSGFYPNSERQSAFHHNGAGGAGPSFVNNDSFAGRGTIGADRAGGAFGLGLPPLSRTGSLRQYNHGVAN